MIARGSLAAVALGLGASLAPVVAVARPEIDPAFYYWLRPARRGLAGAAIGFAALDALARPSRGRWAVVAATAMTGAAAFLYPERFFVPLDRPVHIPAAAAHYGDAAPVLGFDASGAAVAWPVEMLVPHHLINDEVGGRPVLASYCPLCRTGIIYDSFAGGRALTFEVAGLARGNMLMRDRQTGSIWQQATGEAVAGPLRGEQLALLLGEWTTWAAWRADNPATAICVEPPAGGRGIVRFLPFGRMTAHFAHGSFRLPGRATGDRRLPSREEVAGLSVGGEARAYPVAALAARGWAGDRLGGTPILLSYERGADRVRAFARADGGAGALSLAGEAIVASDSGGRWSSRGVPLAGTTAPLRALPIERQWWMAWAEFHPGTTVFADHEW